MQQDPVVLSILSVLQKINREIFQIKWLSQIDAQHIVNIFISDLATRYNNVHDFLTPRFTVHSINLARSKSHSSNKDI